MVLYQLIEVAKNKAKNNIMKRGFTPTRHSAALYAIVTIFNVEYLPDVRKECIRIWRFIIPLHDIIYISSLCQLILET